MSVKTTVQYQYSKRFVIS